MKIWGSDVGCHLGGPNISIVYEGDCCAYSQLVRYHFVRSGGMILSWIADIHITHFSILVHHWSVHSRYFICNWWSRYHRLRLNQPCPIEHHGFKLVGCVHSHFLGLQQTLHIHLQLRVSDPVNLFPEHGVVNLPVISCVDVLKLVHIDCLQDYHREAVQIGSIPIHTGGPDSVIGLHSLWRWMDPYANR